MGLFVCLVSLRRGHLIDGDGVLLLGKGCYIGGKDIL